MKFLGNMIQRIRAYNKLANIGEIVRRYFALNAFDGVLTLIGVLMGNITAGVTQPRIVVNTGLATCIAMGVSGLWGAYLTEAAERKRDLAELNRHTLTDLGPTQIGQASRMAVVMVMLVNGFSPFLAALVVLLPFFVSDLFSDIRSIYYAALSLALIILFSIGLFLGRISQENLVGYGLKTVGAGVVSILIIFWLHP